jgi:hypothetical protein
LDHVIVLNRRHLEDETGTSDWVISDQVHAFITDLLRPIETHLYGRRLYETMAYWDAPVEGYPPEHRDFARIWQKAEKIVFSRTLTGATTRNTRVERDFDLDAIRKLKLEAARAKRATKSELIVVATMIQRMIGTSAFSDRTEFSVTTGYFNIYPMIREPARFGVERRYANRRS